MADRKVRKTIALDTLEIIDKGYYLNSKGERILVSLAQKFAEDNTKVYSPEAGEALLKENYSNLFNEPANIVVNDYTTLDATRQLILEGFDDIVCLNFASAKNPGGGFLGGSQAQEESIARATGLYNCLLKAPEYYKTNKSYKSCFYTDYMIYSPSVPIIKDENGFLLDSLTTTAIITAPAVNTGVVKKQERKKLDRVEEVMKRRISKVLHIALSKGHTGIVLGAWGCGVFGNEPTEIAKYFREVIEETYRYSFKKIVFAVYAKNDRFIKPFFKEFY